MKIRKLKTFQCFPNRIEKTKRIRMQVETKIRLYRKNLPNQGDKVVFEYVKLEETLVRIKLFEYDDYPGIILLNELTRQKRVNSLLKLCPIGQVGVGEVLSTEERAGEICVFVSIKNLSKEDQTKYLEYYYKSKKLCNFMKRIANNTKRSLLETCENLSWPMYEMIAASQDIEVRQEHPLDKIDHPDKIKKATITAEEILEKTTEECGQEAVKVTDETPKKTVVETVKVEKAGEAGEEAEAAEKAEKAEKAEAAEKAEVAEEEDLITEEKATKTTSDDPFDSEKEDATDSKDMKEAEDGKDFKLTKEMAELMLASHEQFFGKLIMQKTIRAGIICYRIDGTQIIKETLINLRESFLKDFPNVTLTFNLRDIPVYEFKLKSLDTDQLEVAHDYVLKNLKNDRLLFRHISTK